MSTWDILITTRDSAGGSARAGDLFEAVRADRRVEAWTVSADERAGTLSLHVGVSAAGDVVEAIRLAVGACTQAWTSLRDPAAAPAAPAEITALRAALVDELAAATAGRTPAAGAA